MKNLVNKLKQRVKESDSIINFLCFIYNMIFSRCRRCLLRGDVIAKGVLLKGTSFEIKGTSNTVRLGRFSKINNCKFVIIGNFCQFVGGGNSVVRNTVFWIEDDYSCISYADSFTMESGHIASTEGNIIKIGNDCMFSNDIEIRNGDSHSIYSTQSGIRINYADSVVIGNHVWLTAHVRVLKGTIIADDIIIGNSSIASGKFTQPNCIYAGNPIKVVKDHVNWRREK